MNINTYELKKAGLEARTFLYYIVSIEKYVLPSKQLTLTGFLQKSGLLPWDWVT